MKFSLRKCYNLKKILKAKNAAKGLGISYYFLKHWANFYLIVFYILFLQKYPTPKKQEKMPNAKEILELLRQKENTLESLHQYSSLAKIHHTSYFQENENFDLEFVSILASHKNVNAKLVLEIEKYFKSINPNRKELLDKALESGLNKR